MKEFYIERDEDNLGYIVRDPQGHPYMEVDDDIKNAIGHAKLICKLLNERKKAMHDTRN